jgi:lysozyme
MCTLLLNKFTWASGFCLGGFSMTTRKYAIGLAFTLALASSGLYTLTADFEGIGKVYGASRAAFLDFLQDNEIGFTTAYKDAVGIPTICFGTTKYPDGRKVALGDKATKAQCREYTAHHYEIEVRPILEKYVTVPVTERQAVALAYNVYNLGPALFWNQGKGTPTRFNTLFNAGKCEEAVQALQAFKYAGGRVLPGLVKVRAKTGAMILEDCHA